MALYMNDRGKNTTQGFIFTIFEYFSSALDVETLYIFLYFSKD